MIVKTQRIFCDLETVFVPQTQGPSLPDKHWPAYTRGVTQHGYPLQHGMRAAHFMRKIKSAIWGRETILDLDSGAIQRRTARRGAVLAVHAHDALKEAYGEEPTARSPRRGATARGKKQQGGQRRTPVSSRRLVGGISCVSSARRARVC